MPCGTDGKKGVLKLHDGRSDVNGGNKKTKPCLFFCQKNLVKAYIISFTPLFHACRFTLHREPLKYLSLEDLNRERLTGAGNITIKRTNSAKKDAASTLRKYPVAARQIRHAVKFGSVE